MFVLGDSEHAVGRGHDVVFAEDRPAALKVVDEVDVLEHGHLQTNPGKVYSGGWGTVQTCHGQEKGTAADPPTISSIPFVSEGETGVWPQGGLPRPRLTNPQLERP